ncbi:EF-hand domain-containing protein [Oceanibaculum pacificum]|uniref:EF-hand domain-containing protein n=1 Tax=Oceanibaculum pacificum TaxID=580166 RepID=A0A154WEL3_9PROT|nr:EF-hand domain-containing protein [Oceanibaculum pacificum]KZD11936.1 hypothetical protein AUP43_17855 [Oceanibaculum pacificum]
MKTKFAFVPAALAAALVIGVPTLGQAASSDGKKQGQPRAEKMMEHLDTDKNGSISREEFAAVRHGKLADYDKDGDGALSKAEYEAMVTAQAQKMAERSFAKLDANKDGKIDQSEREARRDEAFKRLDKNGDGTISPDELRGPKR